MCIAIGKPMGVAIPDESILKNCWNNNSDGAGFAYAVNGNVFIKKGFMTFDSFKSALKEADERYNLKDCGMLLHFRIATHGAKDATMTHPFPINSDEGALKKIEYVSDYAVIHNGIISLTGYEANKSRGLSDTAIFIQKYLTKIATNKKWLNNPANIDLIEDLIDSKMAILYKTGGIKFTSGFKEDNGVYYSNNSYNDNYVKAYKTFSYPLSTTKSNEKKEVDTNYSSYNYDIFELMRVEPGDILDGDFGSIEVSYDELSTYYATKPNEYGMSLIYERYPSNGYYGMFSQDEEYFSDYDFIGEAMVYDRNAKIREWSCDIKLFEDNFLNYCTPDLISFEMQEENIELETLKSKSE